MMIWWPIRSGSIMIKTLILTTLLLIADSDIEKILDSKKNHFIPKYFELDL